MEIEKSVRRKRKHAEEFKRAVVDACGQAGASISGIALANDINPNLAHRWVRERGVTRSSAAPKATVAVAEPAFLPIQIAPAISERRDIRIEFKRGNTGIKIEWPEHSAADCAIWLRDLLR
jgi:transposase